MSKLAARWPLRAHPFHKQACKRLAVPVSASASSNDRRSFPRASYKGRKPRQTINKPSTTNNPTQQPPPITSPPQPTSYSADTQALQQRRRSNADASTSQPSSSSSPGSSSSAYRGQNPQPPKPSTPNPSSRNPSFNLDIDPSKLDPDQYEFEDPWQDPSSDQFPDADDISRDDAYDADADADEDEIDDVDDPEGMRRYLADIRASLDPQDENSPRMMQLLQEMERDMLPQMEASYDKPDEPLSDLQLFNYDLMRMIEGSDDWRQCQETYDVFRTLMFADTLAMLVHRTAIVLKPQLLGRAERAEALLMVSAVLQDLRAMKPRLDPDKTSQLAWALGRLRHGCPDTLAMLQLRAARDLPSYDLEQLADLVVGMAAAGYEPSSGWLDTLLARAMKLAKAAVQQQQQQQQQQQPEADPIAAFQQARAALAAQASKAGAANALASLLCAAAGLRHYQPPDGWCADALQLLRNHLLYLGPGELRGLAAALPALGLVSEGSDGSETWRGALALLQAYLSARLAATPAAAPPEAAAAAPEDGSETDDLVPEDEDPETPAGLARLLTETVAALAAVAGSSSAQQQQQQQQEFMFVWFEAARPALHAMEPPQVVKCLCSVAQLTAAEPCAVWLADVVAYLHMTRTAYSAGQWARVVPALAAALGRAFDRYGADGLAVRRRWLDAVSERLEDVAAVSELRLRAAAAGGLRPSELAGLVEGFVGLGFSPGGGWLAAHEAAVVAAGVRGFVEEGLVEGLAAAYEGLGQRVESMALKAAFQELELAKAARVG